MTDEDVGYYLIKNYYSKYKGSRKDVIPTIEQILQGITNHSDKFVIVRDDKIKGVGIYLTLSDETFSKLESLDVTRVDILSGLLLECGPNVHFILLCADGYKTIVAGVNYIKKVINAKTISWWNPDLNKLHIYNIRRP